jgi:hypothetical protein
MNRRTNVAIRTSYFERDHRDCLSCGEIINHPICPECIAKGFSEWTRRFPELGGVEKKVKRFVKAHKHMNGSSTACVHCGRNSVHICPYCFTEHLYNLIKETGAEVRALTEFLFIFNFDFRHSGYSDELQTMGGY